MTKILAPILLTLVLTACGGGGGGGSSPASPQVTSALRLVATQQNTNTVYNTAVGDLNGDGREDVVVSGWFYNSATSYIWLFTQNADGTMTDSTLTLLPANTHQGSQHVFVADFDNDGRNDIFLAGFIDGNAIQPAHSTMLWGNANGAFTEYVFPETTMAHGACIDDVDHDGDLDMIVAGGGIYFNQGSKNFTLDSSILQGNNYFSACAVTHQADGSVNILLGNNNAVNGYRDNINVYNSAMVFQNAIGFANGPGDLIDAVAVDVNGDGAKDLLTVYNSNAARQVWYNTGINNYTYQTTLDTQGNDYYTQLTVVNNATTVLFPGNATGTRMYRINNGMTVYHADAFTDMAAGRSAQAAAVYRNTSTNQIFMLQLLDNSFYTKEIQ